MDHKDMLSLSVFFPQTLVEAVEEVNNPTNPDPPRKPPSSPSLSRMYMPNSK
ncbi:hypothetical protein DSO57_1015033 [Entomophthora muscae]|uniref:Uncharacterized protein n=1 Tax=Entomophthora muscae TaxID=34485 RepID=A0ACC2RWI0_9FUNG|nr:hypothetical protein DSO57_1015033 [Entomophthora muscae]